MDLRENETLVYEAKAHWLDYGLYLIIVPVPFLFGLNSITFGMAFIALLGVGSRFIASSARKIVITNQRLYVVSGILAKDYRDMPVAQIQSIEVQQNALSRIVGAGDLRIMTGNNLPMLIPNVTDPLEFKNHLEPSVGPKKVS